MVWRDLLQKSNDLRSQIIADLSDVCWFPAELHPCLQDSGLGAALKNIYVISSPRNIFVNNQVGTLTSYKVYGIILSH